MNPTDLQNHQNDKQKPLQHQPKEQGRYAAWLDRVRIGNTLRSWKRGEKRAQKRQRWAQWFGKLPYHHLIGDFLYMVGFWVEYALVRTWRVAKRVARGIWGSAASLAMMVLRPFLLGLITFAEDLASPFVQLFQGLRHIRLLPETLPEEYEGSIGKERVRYFFRGLWNYRTVLWNAILYVMPAVAAAGLFVMVQKGLSLHYVLEVQVDGATVGYVESEQVFENAREDVQARINNAKAMLQEAGAMVSDAMWEISPTYTLSLAEKTMSESEITNAILQFSSSDIVEGTAVYIDNELRFVTNEGDHLRSYLNNYLKNARGSYIEDFGSGVQVGFLHNIRLLDGVYIKESVMPYSDVVDVLNAGGGIQTYTAAEGETVESATLNTGVSFDSLAALNPQLLTLDQEIPEGEQLITGVATAELLKVKAVLRETVPEDIPFETQTTESDEYDFGKIVTLQQGQLGAQKVTREYIYIDGALNDVQVVNIEVTQPSVPQIQVKGTKLKSGMVAKVGSGSFVWPVPGYSYVSRWMNSGHRGADICANLGTEIIASDSGAVINSGWHWSWGNYVEIDHGNGYSTLYAHMSAIAVSTGQAVSQGQVIGYVGNTGNSYGNHLHFEMKHNGVLFSAQSLFPNMRRHR